MTPEKLALISLSLIAAYLLFKNFSIEKKFGELRGFLDDLLGGRLRKRLYLKGRDSYSRLMADLSVLAGDLEEKTGEAKELRARLETILSSIPDAFALLDEKHKFRFINPAFEELFKTKSYALKGRGVAEFPNIPELAPLVREVKAKQGASPLAEGEGGAKITRVFTDTEGKTIETTALPLLDSGGEGFVVVLRDITAQRRIEEVKRDFVANVSHELKTPITAIKGYTETLLDGALDDKENAPKFLGTIKFQTERMERLVRDLITLSQIEFGAMPINKKAVLLGGLGGLVEEVLNLFKEDAASKGLELKRDISADCDRIEADTERLTQVLVNLIDNAIKFTESGSVSVKSRKDGTQCVLSVEDTGIGIPRKYIPRLGERFFRVDASRSRELGGTGLGLAIVKHIVLAHGWRLDVESEAGRGTRVKIILPE